MKLLFLLLLPIFSFAGTNKIKFDPQRSNTIYNMLDIPEERIGTHITANPCGTIVNSRDPRCAKTEVFSKEVGSLKCTVKSITRILLTATGELRPFTSKDYQCIKSYSRNGDDLKIFNALKVKVHSKTYDNSLIETKEIEGLVISKKTYFNYGNTSFTYYKKTNGKLYNDKAKKTYKLLNLPELVYESNIQKKSANISCTKFTKDFSSGEVYQIPRYECSLSHLQNYFYLQE